MSEERVKVCAFSAGLSWEYPRTMDRSLPVIDSSPRPEEGVDEAWAVEIQRRIQSIDNGEVKLVPWDDVMRQMRDRRHG